MLTIRIERDFFKHKTAKTDDKIPLFGAVMISLLRKIHNRQYKLQHLKRFWRAELT